MERIFWFVTLLLAVAIFGYLFRREKFLRREERDPWADPAFVDRVLMLAIDQRAPMGLTLLSDNPDNPALGNTTLSGFCARLDSKTLLFQSGQNLVKEQRKTWAGRHVCAYLHTRLGDNSRLFRFDSQVLAMPSPGNPVLLELAHPLRLDRFDRRAFPRIRPHDPACIALGLWPWKQDSNSLPSYPAILPGAVLVSHPAASMQARLRDISATGLALDLKKGQADIMGTHCFLLLGLRQSALFSSTRALAIWLACSRRHVTGRGVATLGLHIQYWCRVARADVPILLQAADKNGAPPLLHWILKRQANNQGAHFGR